MRGRRHGGRWFTISVLPNGRPYHRLGLIVAKRLTRTSVVRNAVKRMIRELFRVGRSPAGSTGFDIVVQLRALPDDPRAGREELADLLSRGAGLIPPK